MDLLLKILPVILIFVLGYFLKRVNIFTRENGDLFLKLVFYVAFPALLMVSVTRLHLSAELVFLPVAAVLIILVSYAIVFFISRFIHLERPSMGVFIIGAVTMNMGFTYPFLMAAAGEEGLARASFFDFGNGLMIFTFVFSLACRYGGNGKNARAVADKLLLSPPIWALAAAVILNLAGLNIPEAGMDFFRSLGNMTVPLIMLSLGIYFTPKIVRPGLAAAIIALRIAGGFLIGLLFVFLFRLDGLNRSVVLIGAASPVGYNTLIFSSMEKLDKDLAASIISYSVLLGLVLIPLMFFLTF